MKSIRQFTGSGLAVIIALSGWLLLTSYLYYNYVQAKPDFIEQLFSPNDYSQSLFQMLILFAPILSSVIGFAVDNRIKLHRRITMLEERYRDMAAKDLSEMLDSFLFAFINALDAKSPWTKGHSERVFKYAVAIGKEMGLKDDEIRTLQFAALLHDIGKIGTYDILLDKAGKLTEEEYDLIKMHPGKGVEILSPVRKLSATLPVIKQHHERIDGKGYPGGLKGDEISHLAKIVCVADSYDAMTADRPYKSALSREDAIGQLKQKTGTQFDDEVVDVFLKKVLNGNNDLHPGRKKV